MSGTILQHRRGNTAQTAAFTGASAELFINTDKNQLVIHDGVTPGGWGAALPSGYTPNNFIFANATGYLSNTNSLQFLSSNNTIVANTDLLVQGNLVVVGTYTEANINITNFIITTNDSLTISNTTPAINVRSGAFVVTGGAGIGGNLWATAAFANTVQSNSVNAAAMTINSVRVPTITDVLVFNLALG